MRRRSYFILAVFILRGASFTVIGEVSPDEEYSNAKEEYINIFKNIPVLFEYLLVALNDKPEMLEADNPMAFHDVTNSDDSKIEKRDIDDEELRDNDGNVAKVADDIYDEVEGLDGPDNNTADANSPKAENKETDVKITPEELAEKFLMVEQLLEDYNKT